MLGCGCRPVRTRGAGASSQAKLDSGPACREGTGLADCSLADRARAWRPGRGPRARPRGCCARGDGSTSAFSGRARALIGCSMRVTPISSSGLSSSSAPSAWQVATEVSFNLRGERGSIDILAFHPATGSLLVIEVKSVVPDMQAMLAGVDRKGRLARDIARERGWQVTSVTRLLVLPDDRTARRRVERHAATFRTALPARTADVRRWIQRPSRIDGWGAVPVRCPPHERSSPRRESPSTPRAQRRIAG